jgi:cobalt-zinc-cadmium efflux system membrane fusion protein
MKLSLLIIPIMGMLSLFSCHQGKGVENAPASGEEISVADQAGEITISREQFEAMNMEIGDPAPMMFSDRVIANGYVMASPSGCAKISTLVSGRVRNIHFSSGDFINSGQTLFTLEGHEIILLQQTYAEAFQRLKLLKADYERMQKLFEEKIAAQKDYLKAESEYEIVQSEVEGLRARLKMIYIDPSIIENGEIVPFLTVRSPIAGTITRQQLVLGQYLEPFETAMEVVNEDKLRLKLELFEKYISDLRTGQQVIFSAPDRPEHKFRATLSHVGKAVSPEARTVECFAEINGADKKFLLDNMYVESTVITQEREALGIPEEALIKDHDRDYVLILAEEKGDQMIFRQIPVQTGSNRQGYTEILDEEITSILIKGVYNLWSGE